jgi:Ca2+-binding EF-hand superfamily protein
MRAFEVINRNNPTNDENCISLIEFKEILRSHGVFTLDRDIKNLFDRFDKDRDGIMSFKDFSNEMITV